MKRIFLYFFCIINSLMMSCNNDTLKTDLADKAMNELKVVLRDQSQFIKVHAAEYLIWLGHKDEVKKVYLAEDSLHNTETPYRIGIWRVLAQAEENPAEKNAWVRKVLDVYGNPAAPDRLHATETLAKLEQSPLEEFPELTEKTLHSDNRNLNTYALWAISYSSDSAIENNRKEFLRLALEDTNQIIRKISAYILRKIRGLSQDEWKRLAEHALSEPALSEMRRSLLNTAFVTLPDDAGSPEPYRKIHDEMLSGFQQLTVGERIELALSLADKGDGSDLAILESMLNNEHIAGFYEAESKEGADVRATAAYAILKIKERNS